MATLKSAKKPSKLTLVNIKVTPLEKKAIKALADRYAKGNLSLWLRYAAINCRPRKEDLE